MTPFGRLNQLQKGTGLEVDLFLFQLETKIGRSLFLCPPSTRIDSVLDNLILLVGSEQTEWKTRWWLFLRLAEQATNWWPALSAILHKVSANDILSLAQKRAKTALINRFRKGTGFSECGALSLPHSGRKMRNTFRFWPTIALPHGQRHISLASCRPYLPFDTHLEPGCRNGT